MLSGNESIAKYSRPNVAIWMAMAFQAGLLNIGAFLACRRPVSHMTGYMTFLGMDLANPNVSHAGEILTLPLAFVLGAVISGYLVDLRIKLKQKPEYYLTFGIVFLALQLVYTGGTHGWYGPFGAEPRWPGLGMLSLLCLCCGILNGTVTTVSRSIVRTTHLTGPMTDLGIGIVRFLHRERIGESVHDEGHANLVRIAIILAFGSGTVLGVFLFQAFGFEAFLLPLLTAAALFGVMFYFQIWKARGRA